MKANQPLIKYVAKMGRYIFIGLFVIISTFVILYPQLFNCEIIRFSKFREVKPQIFVSPEISISQISKILKTIQYSEMRVDSFYSGKLSRPIIVVCRNGLEYEKYCSSSEGAGCSLATPWGSSFIILNGEGMNTDVISHEMSHVELFSRLGWWKTTTQIPQWFNEGIALMLDKRFVDNPDVIGKYFDYMDEWLYYTRGGQEILELKDITSVKDFFNGNQQYVMLAYMTSGLEISYWLHYAGKKGIGQLISNMENGLSFEAAYEDAESKRSKLSKQRILPLNPLRRPM